MSAKLTSHDIKNGRRGLTSQYAHYRETTPMWKLYMMPGSRSSDLVWIRIRPDSELLDPVWIWIRPEPKCLDPDPAGSENCGSVAPLVVVVAAVVPISNVLVNGIKPITKIWC